MRFHPLTPASGGNDHKKEHSAFISPSGGGARRVVRWQGGGKYLTILINYQVLKSSGLMMKKF